MTLYLKLARVIYGVLSKIIPNLCEKEIMDNSDKYMLYVNIVEAYFKDNKGLKLISLCTSDGFPIAAAKKSYLLIENDKFAAASSTLFSVSNAVASQFFDLSFDVTTIESDQGNIAVNSILIEETDCILCIAGDAGMNVGTLRLHIRRCADELVRMKAISA